MRRALVLIPAFVAVFVTSLVVPADRFNSLLSGAAFGLFVHAVLTRRVIDAAILGAVAALPFYLLAWRAV